jgi:asparagine synthase (glutamine-hydrolysing)
MCGILGVYKLERKSRLVNELMVETALNEMHHRGPDAQEVVKISDTTILAHLRLSIIDLSSESNQPFQLDNRYWMTYNGEIYNYVEIREELLELGCSFRTEGDTEVLLRAYEIWGTDCVKRFNGMWAFAIYDNVEETLFCSRDRFGVKPFNYTVYQGQFVFSSEIKAILHLFPELARPNYDVIANFCRTSTGAQHPQTWFEGILRLQPAHNLLIDKNEIKTWRYWTYPTVVDKTINETKAIERYKTLFIDAVRLRMRSDVPVGTTLSSGLDSTSIVSTLRTFFEGEHFTYTAAFDSKSYGQNEKSLYKESSLEIDETKVVKQVANDKSLTTNFVNVDYSEFVHDLQNIIHHLESGNSSPAVFPLMQVMERAHKDVTVVLEGQGADELLGGYVHLVLVRGVWSLLKKGQINSAYRMVSEFRKVYSLNSAILMHLRHLSNHIPAISSLRNMFSGLNSIYGPHLSLNTRMSDYPDIGGGNFDDPINRELARQHAGGLVNLLHYGDAISMAYSLESRLPFMDYRLVEFSFKLPWYYKIDGIYGKAIHRKGMKDIVPDYILFSKIKFGFNSPIAQFFKSNTTLKVKPIDVLLSKRCLDRALFDPNGLRKIIDQHDKGKKNHSTLLFRLLMVELWFRTFIDSKNDNLE